MAGLGPNQGNAKTITPKNESLPKDSGKDLFFICGILRKTEAYDYHL